MLMTCSTTLVQVNYFADLAVFLSFIILELQVEFYLLSLLELHYSWPAFIKMGDKRERGKVTTAPKHPSVQWVLEPGLTCGQVGTLAR